MTLTIAELREKLVVNVQSDLGITKAAAKHAVDTVFANVASIVADNAGTPGFTFRIHELGSFKVKAVAAHTVRSPKDGSKKEAPARTAVKFTLTKALKDLGK